MNMKLQIKFSQEQISLIRTDSNNFYKQCASLAQAKSKPIKVTQDKYTY
jgi:hypothetical protein